MAQEPKQGDIVHVELITKEVAGAKKFFGDLFGWKFQDMPEMGYSMWQSPGVISGGLMAPRPEQPGTGQPLNYIYVESIDVMAPRIERAGGKVVVPKTAIPGFGWFAFFKYPEEMIWGLYEPEKKANPQDEKKGAKKK